MPETSPSRQALLRLIHRRSACVGLVVVGVFVFVGLYAPFLAGDVALYWRDADGVRFPVIAELFSQSNFAKHWYDLLFNLAGLLLPVCALLLPFLRGWRWSRRLLAAAVLLVVAFAACFVPLQRAKNGELQPPWRKRADSSFTYAHLLELRELSNAPAAIFPLIPHRWDSTFAGAVLKSPGTVNQGSGRSFVMGTDSAGRDVLSQLIFGARVSLTVGLLATGISLLIGTILGAVSGYFGGWVDILLQRLVEVMMCFPTFILILVVVAMMGRDIFVIMAVIGLTGWAGTARLVRGEFLAQAVRDYVAAAESLGLPRWRIMFRHILPNALTPLIISATFGIAGAIGSEATLAFVGLGDVSVPSWGVLSEQGREHFEDAWLIIAPGLSIFAMITALNLIGNALREVFDPRSAR